jgi:hypothetical protein
MKIALVLMGLCLLVFACGTTAQTDIAVPGKGRIIAGMTGDEVRSLMGSEPNRVGSGRTGCNYTSHFRYRPGSGTTEWAWNVPGEVLVVYLENGIVANVGYARP